jgi:hypothetical protein
MKQKRTLNSFQKFKIKIKNPKPIVVCGKGLDLDPDPHRLNAKFYQIEKNVTLPGPRESVWYLASQEKLVTDSAFLTRPSVTLYISLTKFCVWYPASNKLSLGS